MTDKKKYSAPALKKGLEILELLSLTGGPLSLSEISEKLHRSQNEIFRMVQELEHQGYIQRDSRNSGYDLTNRLFRLGMVQPKISSLLDAALPEMRKLVVDLCQSCHIAVMSDEQIIVIERVEAPTPVSFSARIGHRQFFHETSSGITIFAHSSKETQEESLGKLEGASSECDRDAILTQATSIIKKGYNKSLSRYVKGVTDYSAPIFRNGHVVAALTAPCIKMLNDPLTERNRVTLLKDYAQRISRELSSRI